MTAPGALVDVLSRTRNLFLDFDGPICGIFAGYPAPTIAAELRELYQRGGGTVTPEMEQCRDPLRVLQLSADGEDDALHRAIARALRDAEVTAAETAEPTPHLGDVIEAALSTGRRLAVVSNNSREAVTAYLTRHGLLSSFGGVVGRYDGMPVRLLKPSHHLIGLALTGTDAPPSTTALVGDSTSDIQAARSVPVAAIGYANKPGKAQRLADAGADAIIERLAELAAALATTAAR